MASKPLLTSEIQRSFLIQINPSSTSLTSCQWNAGFYCLESFFHLAVKVEILIVLEIHWPLMKFSENYSTSGLF